MFSSGDRLLVFALAPLRHPLSPSRVPTRRRRAVLPTRVLYEHPVPTLITASHPATVDVGDLPLHGLHGDHHPARKSIHVVPVKPPAGVQGCQELIEDARDF